MVSTSLSRCQVHRRSTFSRAEYVFSPAEVERSQPIGVLGAELLKVQGAPPGAPRGWTCLGSAERKPAPRSGERRLRPGISS